MTTRSPSRRGLTIVLLAGLMLAVGAALAMAAVVPKTSGSYSNRGIGKQAYQYLTFQVVKHGSAYEVENFGINCYTNNDDIGAIYAKKDAKISSKGAFSYKGSATQYHNGQPSGTATLDLSGKFVSSTKATGKATFTSKQKLTGCPAASFTAYWAK